LLGLDLEDARLKLTYNNILLFGLKEEEIPKEFGRCPFKTNHDIHYNPIYKTLYEYVWDLNSNLNISNVVSFLNSFYSHSTSYN
jgi:hypothetical protein